MSPFTFRPKRVLIVVVILGAIVTFPIWTRWWWDRDELVCIQEEPDGRWTKQRGELCKTKEL